MIRTDYDILKRYLHEEWPTVEGKRIIQDLAQRCLEPKDVVELVSLKGFRNFCKIASSDVCVRIFQGLRERDLIEFGPCLFPNHKSLIEQFKAGLFNFDCYAHRRLITNYMRKGNYLKEFDPIFIAIGEVVREKSFEAIHPRKMRGLMYLFYEDDDRGELISWIIEDPDALKSYGYAFIETLKILGKNTSTFIFSKLLEEISVVQPYFLKLFIAAGVEVDPFMKYLPPKGHWKNLMTQFNTLYSHCSLNLYGPHILLNFFRQFKQQCASPEVPYTTVVFAMISLCRLGIEIDSKYLHPDVRNLNIDHEFKLLMTGFFLAPRIKASKWLKRVELGKYDNKKRYKVPEYLPIDILLPLLRIILKTPELATYENLYFAGMTPCFKRNDHLLNSLIYSEIVRLFPDFKDTFFLFYQDFKASVEIGKILVSLQKKDLGPYQNYAVSSTVKILWLINDRNPGLIKMLQMDESLACDPRIIIHNKRSAYPWDDKLFNHIKEWEKTISPDRLVPLLLIWNQLFNEIDNIAYRPWYITMRFRGVDDDQLSRSLLKFLLVQDYDISFINKVWGRHGSNFLKEEWKELTGQNYFPFRPSLHLFPLLPYLKNFPIERVECFEYDRNQTLQLAYFLFPLIKDVSHLKRLFLFCYSDDSRNMIKEWLKDVSLPSPDPIFYQGVEWKSADFPRPSYEMMENYRIFESYQNEHTYLNLEQIWNRDHLKWSKEINPSWFCHMRYEEMDAAERFSFNCFLMFGEKLWIQLNHSSLYEVMNQCFEHPEIYAKTIGASIHTILLSLESNGVHRHTGLHVIKTLFPNKFHHLETPTEFSDKVREALATNTYEKVEHLNELENIIGQCQVFGRSYLYREGKKVTVYKIGRESEFAIHEAAIIEVLKADTLFKSIFPQPVKTVIVENLSQRIIAPIEQGGIALKKYRCPVYKYETDSNYLRYLNGEDVTDEEFALGHRAFVYDSIRFVRQGKVVLTVADLFHNNTQGRRLLPLRDLFKPEPNSHDTTGLGRIDNVDDSVRFPNGRVTGLADFADAVPFEDIQKVPESYAKDLIGLTVNWETIANCIGEILLTDLLMNLRRLDVQGKINWEDQDICNQIIIDMQESVALTIHAYTGKSEEASLFFVVNCGFNWDLFARETLYWFQNNDRGYYGGLKRGVIPEEVQPASGKFRYARATSAANFKFWKGLSSDGINKDVGIYNAPCCWSTFELLLYNVIVLIMPLAERKTSP